MNTNDKIIKECNELLESLGNIPFDKALPDMQDGLWRIALKYGTTGPDVFKIYMDWKSEQTK